VSFIPARIGEGYSGPGAAGPRASYTRRSSEIGALKLIPGIGQGAEPVGEFPGPFGSIIKCGSLVM
jgi:hypothetical protein